MNSDPETIPTTQAVVMFGKPAEPGRVKTRLTDVLSEGSAAELYKAFLEDLCGALDRFRKTADVPTEVVFAHAGAADHPSFAPVRRHGFQFIHQGHGGLGERMARVSKWCLNLGADRLAIIGSDSPTLGAGHFESAFDALEEADVTLGPSFDGGYYLVGLTEARAALFADIDWSTTRVLEQTLKRCQQHDLLCQMLEFWYDVDTFEDLYRLRVHLIDYLEAHGHSPAPATAQTLRQLDDDGVFTRNATRLESP